MAESRLKQLRKERGYTQVKMQLLTGIDQSDYSKIENGKRYYILAVQENRNCFRNKYGLSC